MYNNVTDAFKTMIRSPSRTFRGRLKINDKWIYANFKKLSYETSSSSEEYLQLGSAVAAKIEITIKRIDELFENTEIPVEIGLKLPSGKYEYIPVGFFTAEHPTNDQTTTTFIAYDRMMKTTGLYVSNLTYPASAVSVLNEISAGCGVPVDVSNVDSSIMVLTRPVGYTYREMIGYIASMAGGFACVDRTGTIVIKWYSDVDYKLDVTRIMSFEKDESNYNLEKLSCNVDNSTTLTSGGGILGVTFDNPFMTQDRLDNIFKKLSGFSYRGASVKTLGDVRLDPWDMITVEDGEDAYKVPVMNIQQEYDGGLAMTITSYGKTQTEQEVDFKGPTTQQNKRIYSDLILAKELITKKVDAEWVKANTVQAETIVSINNDLENIRNNYLKSNVAKITYATIESLKSLSGEFADLKATDFEAIKASVKDLNVDVEKVNTLLFGSATGTTITTDFANSVVSVIGDAQITSAMIKELAFDKITGIDINTTVMNVHSEDGKSIWKDNTIQISDKDRVRIQLGKDAAGDYNIYIWDKNGNLMFDPLYGIQESGIKKAIIRNDMVSDNAAISGKKLDIDSVFSVMNADKSNTFNASKIHVDTTDQTLESTFQTINNYVSGGSDAWGSTMLQAKTFIEHKLWWTDIDEEGNSVKSKFNDVKTTLDSFKIDMSDVTKQLNGTFEIYDITEVPTLDNYPATEFFVKVYPAEDWYPLETDTWQYTQEEYAKHAGAVAYMKSSNRAWKFLKQSSGTYGWTEISASETAYMLNKHAAFQVAIDGITAEVSRVKVDIRDNYSTTESVKSLIQQNTESLTSSISKSYATTTFVNDQVSDTKKYADTAAGNAKTTAEKTAADSLNTAVKNVKDYADSAASVAQAAAEGTAASALSDALKNYTVTKDMNSAISQTADGIKTYVSYNYKRTGGEFNTYIVSEVPTLNNYPATEFFVPVYPAEDWYPLETDTWQYTDAGYVLHIGAIAYNPDTGKTWNFVKKDTGWTWEEISSSETAYMLNSFAKHDVALNSITNELSSVRKDISDNYSTTTEMVNRIVQEIKDDKSTISSSLQATYATQKYADDAANAATSGANNYTDNALKTYSTTADIIQAISPGETSISAAVTAKLGDYATSASLKALIENKDGQLKSAIEAIADTINITAKGGLNLSGNRIAIDSDNFTLTEDGRITKCKNIIVDGGTVGGWKIGDKSIYSSYDYNDVTYDVSLHKAEKPSTHILQVTKEKNNLFDYTFFITAEGKMCSYGQLQESGNTFNSEACLFGGYLKMLDTTNNTYTLIHPHGIHARNKENINTLTLVSNSDDGSGDGLIITGSAGTEVSVLRDSITLWYQPNSQKYTKIGKGYVRICNNNTNYYKDCALSVIGGIKTDSFKLYNQNIGWCGAALNRTSDNDISFGWDGTYLRIYIDNTIIASYKYSPGNSEWV
nr:MAG TPA: Minor structural protein [Bacteriophage sp.]